MHAFTIFDTLMLSLLYNQVTILKPSRKISVIIQQLSQWMFMGMYLNE